MRREERWNREASERMILSGNREARTPSLARDSQFLVVCSTPMSGRYQIPMEPWFHSYEFWVK